MKKKIQIFLTAILVIISLVAYNTTDSIELMSTTDITSKENLSQFGNFIVDENEEIVSVLVYLKDQVDLDSINKQMDTQRATLRERHETTVVALQNTAHTSQTKLVEHLNELQSQKFVKDFKCFWIGNIIRVDTYQSVADQIALRDDVLWVYPNYEIELIEPVDERFKIASGNNDEIEPGVLAVRAPEIWNKNITGEGILVATIDTGVDGSHPALANRWAGVADPRYEGHPEWAWFDPYTYQNDFPFDSGSHGTHTMGTVCGGAPGDQIGVAPGALWISAGAIDRTWSIQQTVSDAIESFEWMIDPDGDPTTNWDVPDVCSNSWRVMTQHGYPPCNETFWTFLDACEAAGTVIIFSAGNEGYAGLGRPPDRATDDYRCFAVAAVDANDPNWTIADFSSRGPTFCTPNGTEAIKPDIAAPGVNVRSSIPGGGYTSYSGTSMASPHINGVVALIRQASPNISVQEIKQIIFETAYDLGDPGEDNDYGWGMVDAYEAVLPFLPTKPIIEGPTNGTKLTYYNYTFKSTDPDGDDVYYWINWGDGTSSGWIGPYISGEEIIVSHAWEEPGKTYEIRVKAKNIYDHEGEWSENHSLYILMPPFLKASQTRGGILTVSAKLKNTGEVEATNVEWNFDIKGGIILAGRESTGVIACIQPDSEVTIESNPIIGFGGVTVTIQAKITENTGEKISKGFVFLFYIYVIPSGS